MIRIRPAHESDVEAVSALTVAAYRSEGFASPDYLARLADARDRYEHAILLVAIAEDALAGTVTVAPPGSPWQQVARPHEHELRMLAVDPRYRGLGIGTALVRTCQCEPELGPPQGLVACTLDSMTGAHRIYRSLGFVRDPARDWQPTATSWLRAFAWSSRTGGDVDPPGRAETRPGPR